MGHNIREPTVDMMEMLLGFSSPMDIQKYFFWEIYIEGLAVKNAC